MEKPREPRSSANSTCVHAARFLIIGALLFGSLFVEPLGHAQDGRGAVAGKLTDLYSRPLAHTSLSLRNTRSGEEAQTVTDRNGMYHFAGLTPGEYILEATSANRGSGRLTGIRIAPGHEAHVQAALALVPPSETSDRAAAREPNAGGRAADLARNSSAVDPVAAQSTHENAAAIQRIHAPVGVAGTRDPGPLAAVDMPAPSGASGGGAIKPVPEAGPVRPSAMLLAASVPAGIFRHDTGLAMAAVCGLQAQLQAASSPLNRIEVAIAPASVPAEVRGEDLQQLPLADRDWAGLVLDQPDRATDTLQEDTGRREGTVSWRHGMDSIRFEGSPAGLAFGERRSGRGMVASLLGVNTNASVIREVTPASQSLSGTLNGVEFRTPSGNSTFHGQISIFDRQNLWGAHNPLTSWLKETSSSTSAFPSFTALPYTAPDRAWTWEAAAGGPLKVKQLFWFGGINLTTRNDPGVATVKHPDNFFAQPSNDELQLLSARLELSQTDPVGEGLAAFGAALRQLATLLGPAPRTSTQRGGFGRLDWEGLERHRVTLEGLQSLWDAPGGGFRRAAEPYGNHSFGSDRASELWLMGRWQAFLTPNLMAVTQASAGRHILTNLPETPSTFEKSLLASAWGQLPQMVVDSRSGFTLGTPARFGTGSNPDERVYQAQEMIDWVHRKLLVRTSFEFQHDADSTGFVRNHLGTFSYSRVENFIADALVFSKYGLTDALDPANQHNCDVRGQAWRDATGQLHGLGYLPCYAHYTQTVGPTDWFLSTNDWAGFAAAQWQGSKRLLLAAGLRWQYEQLPPSIAKLVNPDLPQAGKLANPGREWAPRVSLAWGMGESRLPVIQAGYGLRFSRTPNAVLETLLTRTGSANGDARLFARPTDNLAGGGAPPFPYALAGSSGKGVRPGVAQTAPDFRNPEVHEAEVAIQEHLPGRIEVSATAQVSLARHLPVTQDTNIDPAMNPGSITYTVMDASGKGPLHGQVTVPFFASWPASLNGGRLDPGYQGIMELSSRANSTYEAAILRISRSSRRGLNLHARYTYAHAADWNPYLGAAMQEPSMLDPTNFRLEYGTSDLDVRHSGSASLIWETPWKIKSWSRVANGWKVSGLGHFSSGLPYTMRSGGFIPEFFPNGGDAIVGLGTGMNGSGGDDRVYGVGRNTFRYPMTWKADVRLGKRFDLGHMREAELYAESFNLFNHKNVTLLETTGYTIGRGGVEGTPTLNYLTGLKTGQTEFGQPMDVNATDFLRPRQIDFGMRMRF